MRVRSTQIFEISFIFDSNNNIAAVKKPVLGIDENNTAYERRLNFCKTTNMKLQCMTEFVFICGHLRNLCSSTSVKKLQATTLFAKVQSSWSLFLFGKSVNIEIN